MTKKKPKKASSRRNSVWIRHLNVLPRLSAHTNKDSIYTLQDKHSHTHMPAVGGSELQTKSWHFFGSAVQVSSAQGFWINGCEMIYLGYLPPEHRRTEHNPPTPPLLFIQRTNRQKDKKILGSESHSLKSTKFTAVSVNLQFRLLFWRGGLNSEALAVRHNGKYHAENRWFTDPIFFSKVHSIIKWNTHDHTLTTRDVCAEAAAARTRLRATHSERRGCCRNCPEKTLRHCK